MRLFLVFAITLPVKGYATGIPVVDVVKVTSEIQRLIKSAARTAQSERLIKQLMSNQRELSRSRNNSRQRNATNLITRVSGSLEATHNAWVRESTTPYYGACPFSTASKENSQAPSNNVAKAFAKLRAQRTIPVLSPSVHNLTVEGGDRSQFDVDQAVSNHAQLRNAMIDQKILDSLHDSHFGLDIWRQNAFKTTNNAGKASVLRDLLAPVRPYGKEIRPPSVNSDHSVRTTRRVRNSVAGVFTSISGLPSLQEDLQSTITEADYVPAEAALRELADPAKASAMIEAEAKNSRLRTDHSGYQKVTIIKAQNLGSLYREYRRGQVELLMKIATIASKESR